VKGVELTIGLTARIADQRSNENIFLYFCWSFWCSFFLCGARYAMPCAPSGLRQIDAAQKQHEFFVAEDDFAFLSRGFRPAKTPFLQALVALSEMQVIRSQPRALCG
jgi:hypothetical protein